MLVTGRKYWLGAVYGVYSASLDSFDTGNTWVHRLQTFYRDPSQPLIPYRCAECIADGNSADTCEKYADTRKGE